MVSIRSCFSGFKALDFLAPNVSLNVAGSSGVKTHLGAFMTLIAAGLFTLMSVVIIHAYVRTDNPSVTQEVRYKTTYPRINILEAGMYPVIFPYLDDTTPILSSEASKYLSFAIVKARYESVPGSDVQTVTKVHMFYKPCKTVADSGKNKLLLPGPDAGYIYKMVDQYGLCVDYDESESFIGGRLVDDVYEEIYFNVDPCSLEDIGNCATTDEMGRVAFMVATALNTIDLSNKEKPLSRTMKSDDYFYINSYIGVLYTNQMKETSVYDNQGYYLGDSKVSSYYSVDKMVPSVSTRDATKLYCTKQEVIDDECDHYYSFLYISGGHETVITRTYKDLVSTLGDIGGIMEFLLVPLMLLYWPYNKYVTKQHMVSQVYGLYSESETSSCCRQKKQHNFKMDSQLAKVQPIGPKTEPILTKNGEPSNSKGVPPKVFESAFDMIQNKLDVISMVKELNTLKFLADFFLQDYQKILVPLIALKHDLESKEKVGVLRMITKRADSVVSSSATKHSMSLNKSYQILREEIKSSSNWSNGRMELYSPLKNDDFESSQPQTEVKDWSSGLKVKVDTFCLSSLQHSIFFPEEPTVNAIELNEIDTPGLKPPQSELKSINPIEPTSRKQRSRIGSRDDQPRPNVNITPFSTFKKLTKRHKP